MGKTKRENGEGTEKGYNKTMKTKSVAEAGVLCGLYGVLLFMNTMGGFWIESLFPYAFALPILIAALREESAISLCALAAMFVLTWMLSGIRTLLIAGVMLLAGWIFGWGLRRHISLMWTSLCSLVLLFVLNWLELSALAWLFGFEGVEERQMYALIAPWISWNGFLGLLAFVQAFLETFALACMSLLMALKVLRRAEIVQLKVKVGISPMFLWGFCVIFPIWIMEVLNMVSFPVEIRDLLLFGWLICLMALIFRGCQVMLARLHPHAARWQVMACVLCGFVPVLSLIPAATGAAALLRESIGKVRKGDETI